MHSRAVGPAAVVGVAHRVGGLAEVDGLPRRQLDDHDALAARGADARLGHADALAADLADLQPRRNGFGSEGALAVDAARRRHDGKLLVRRPAGDGRRWALQPGRAGGIRSASWRAWARGSGGGQGAIIQTSSALPFRAHFFFQINHLHAPPGALRGTPEPMRLTSIKLSGFKSFAEPTTFQLPGQRVGVVGPNGCGKSNIIDAVRWVLGESKASELRGESMQDVIFNGSTSRKPASRASVELVFDNTLARAGGQWNSYAEIAVRRVLTRDGTSSYYINGQPVRRRDVQDVFLGTGPRAARLRHHRPGHDQPHHRNAAPKSCACSWKRPPASASTRSAAARPRTGSRTRART